MNPGPTDLTVIPVPGFGAEDVLVSEEGWVYTGTEDGAVFEIEPGAARVRRVGTTGGRPLGLEWLPDGRLLVCDPHEGLLAMDRRSGAVEVLVHSVAGKRMAFCNNAAVHSSGAVYFSDSSKVHSIERWKWDFLEDTHTGRLLRRDPSGEVTVLVEGLRFANGVALAADESYVCVAESRGRTVVRHWLAGPRAGATDTLAEDLPGYPDNIARGSDGLIWVTIGSPTDPVVEFMGRAPLWFRRVLLRLPQALQPQPARTVRVLALAEDGKVVLDLDLAADQFRMATGVREHQGRVWIGSLHEPAVAWVDL